MIIYTTGVTCKIGADASHYASVSNIKSFAYEEMQGEDGEGATPVMVINQTVPLGYNLPHKYCKLTLQCTSEAYTALYAAITGDSNSPHIVPGGDNKIINYFLVTAQANDAGTARTVTLTCANVMPGKVQMNIDASGKEVVTTYNFKCDSVTPTYA